jgi:hypothetical protein
MFGNGEEAHGAVAYMVVQVDEEGLDIGDV